VWRDRGHGCRTQRCRAVRYDLEHFAAAIDDVDFALGVEAEGGDTLDAERIRRVELGGAISDVGGDPTLHLQAPDLIAAEIRVEVRAGQVR